MSHFRLAHKGKLMSVFRNVKNLQIISVCNNRISSKERPMHQVVTRIIRDLIPLKIGAFYI